MEVLCNVSPSFSSSLALKSREDVWAFLQSIGFGYIPEYIQEDDEKDMITELDAGLWREDLGNLSFYIKPFQIFFLSPNWQTGEFKSLDKNTILVFDFDSIL